ncbi:MAG: sulfite exporter TauE/SafE family protein [Desulfovibrionaceae bacterium]
MNTFEIITLVLAGFLSGVIKNGVGIGSGIFLLPTLSVAFPAKVALGLGAPLMLASDIFGLFYYWKEWASVREIRRILLSAIPGLLLGTVMLSVIPARLFALGVGLFGMTYALCMLWPLFPPLAWLKKIPAYFKKHQSDKEIYFYGALGGFASVIAHAGGLVWSLYFLSRIPDKRIFVGTIVILFFITNIYKTCAYVYIGTLSIDSLIAILPAIPAVLMGSYLGNIANKKMNNVLFKRVVFCMIFLTSLKMCV